MAYWRPFDEEVVNGDSDRKNFDDSSNLCNKNDEEMCVVGEKSANSHPCEDLKKRMLHAYDKLFAEGHPNPTKRVAELLNFAENTIRRLVKNRNENKDVNKPSSSCQRVDQATKDLIARKIYEIYNTNIVPTLKLLRFELSKDDVSIQYQDTQFYKLLKSMGFKQRTLNRRQCVMESNRLKLLRTEFLSKIFLYRTQNRPIIYLDETWFDTHDVVKSGLSDGSMHCVLKSPPSRGKRVIILHAGSKDGWIPNCLLLSAKNIKNCSADYHEDMTGDLFENWFTSQLLPNIPNNSVIVMDNASYHSRLLKKRPTAANKKAEIVAYFQNEGLKFAEKCTKKDLLQQLDMAIPYTKQYFLDEKAATEGHSILRLPPYYCISTPLH